MLDHDTEGLEDVLAIFDNILVEGKAEQEQAERVHGSWMLKLLKQELG